MLTSSSYSYAKTIYFNNGPNMIVLLKLI